MLGIYMIFSTKEQKYAVFIIFLITLHIENCVPELQIFIEIYLAQFPLVICLSSLECACFLGCLLFTLIALAYSTD